MTDVQWLLTMIFGVCVIHTVTTLRMSAAELTREEQRLYWHAAFFPIGLILLAAGLLISGFFQVGVRAQLSFAGSGVALLAALTWLTELAASRVVRWMSLMRHLLLGLGEVKQERVCEVE